MYVSFHSMCLLTRIAGLPPAAQDAPAAKKPAGAAKGAGKAQATPPSKGRKPPVDSDEGDDADFDSEDSDDEPLPGKDDASDRTVICLAPHPLPARRPSAETVAPAGVLLSCR